MKAALYFDNADGFGDWTIFLNNRATQNLREARRTDAKHFGIIVKKMKYVIIRDDVLRMLTVSSTGSFPMVTSPMTIKRDSMDLVLTYLSMKLK